MKCFGTKKSRFNHKAALFTEGVFLYDTLKIHEPACHGLSDLTAI
jgi:hypothetical protein|tara:strand:+ start:3369 stop:3503 length:135 start_codon:yes stop_codon:yes gene_type:complete